MKRGHSARVVFLVSLVFILLPGTLRSQEPPKPNRAQFEMRVDRSVVEEQLATFKKENSSKLARARHPEFTGSGVIVVRLHEGMNAPEYGIELGGFITHRNGQAIRLGEDSNPSRPRKMTYFSADGTMKVISLPAGPVGYYTIFAMEDGPAMLRGPYADPRWSLLVLAALEWVKEDATLDLAESAIAIARNRGLHEGPLRDALASVIRMRRQGHVAAYQQAKKVPADTYENLPPSLLRWLYLIGLANGDLNSMEAIASLHGMLHQGTQGELATGPDSLNRFIRKQNLERSYVWADEVRKNEVPPSLDGSDPNLPFRPYGPREIFGPDKQLRRIDIRNKVDARDYASTCVVEGKPFIGSTSNGTYSKQLFHIPAAESHQIEFKVTFTTESLGSGPEYSPLTRIGLMDKRLGMGSLHNYLGLSLSEQTHLAYSHNSKGLELPYRIPFDGKRHELTLRVFDHSSEIILDGTRLALLFNSGHSFRGKMGALIPMIHVSGSRVDVHKVELNHLTKDP